MKLVKKILWFCVWCLPVGFVENALFGWAQMKLGITNEIVEHILRYSIMWGIPALTVAVAFYFYYLIVDSRSHRVSAGSTLSPAPSSAQVEPVPELIPTTIEVGKTVSQRISFVTLLKEAEKRGTNFTDGSHAIVTLSQALRQAGCDGDLQFFGRVWQETSPPLLPIDKDHWKIFEIDWVPALDLAGPNGGIGGVMPEADNYFVSSRRVSNSNLKGYRDLHVDRAQALKLLQQNGRQSNAFEQTIGVLSPDWPIRELFYHLWPGLRGGEDTAYDGLKIKDKLSTSELKIWGRRISYYGDVKPFYEIDPTYWQRADFTYMFLAGDEGSNHSAHTAVDENSGLAEYYNLHVCKAQALKIWPDALTEKKDRWTWPALTKAEISALYVYLKEKGGTHSIHIACDNSQCQELSESFAKVFKRLAWPYHIGSGLFDAQGVRGLLLQPDNETSRMLKNAIEFNTGLEIEIATVARDSGSSAESMLIIGSRN